MLRRIESLSLRKIFFFWVPLAATWLMMAAEGPFLAAIIARMDDPKFNLAAYGVAFSVAVFIEAPIIMIMSASTALAKDRDSFLKLRNFTYALNALITMVMVVFVLPPVFFHFAEKIIALPSDVARLTHAACIALLPWPSAIGYRRFYQGILIRSNLTRRVAYGTVVRLFGMASTALICFELLDLNGALVGGLALSVGVTGEAVASRLMARASVHNLLIMDQDHSSVKRAMTYRDITSFYYPLALTSVLGLSIPPMVTFFMGHSRMALESLAVLPVINSLVFIFRSMGLSYQEVGIALLGENNEGFRPLRDFALLLGTLVVAGLSLVAFTPLSKLWFHSVSGLSSELTQFSLGPTRILAPLPGLMVLLSFQRALMVNHRRTKSVTFATAIEVMTIITLLSIGIQVWGMVGAVAAAVALVAGRLMANIYLFFPLFQMRDKVKGTEAKLGNIR